MSIKRAIHDAEHPYTVICNQTLRNMNLSLKAKSVLCICLSFADEWQFNLNDLSRRLKINKNTLNKCLIELEERGYLIRKKTRNTRGKITGVVYEFYEIPIPEKQDLENRDLESQDLQKPHPLIQEPQNKPIRNIKENKYQKKEMSVGNITKAKNILVKLGRSLHHG